MQYYINNDLHNLSDNDKELKAIYDKLKKFYDEDKEKERKEFAKRKALMDDIFNDLINHTEEYFPKKERSEINDLKWKARQYSDYNSIMSIKLKKPYKATIISLYLFFGFFAVDRFYAGDYIIAILRLLVNVSLIVLTIFNLNLIFLIFITVFACEFVEFFAVPRRIRKKNAENMKKHCRAIIAKHDSISAESKRTARIA